MPSPSLSYILGIGLLKCNFSRLDYSNCLGMILESHTRMLKGFFGFDCLVEMLKHLYSATPFPQNVLLMPATYEIINYSIKIGV